MMQETQENVKESFIKRFFNSLGKADIDDSENVEYEKTAEFSMLSENDKAELLNAEKSIDEKDVDYAGEVRKMNKQHNLFVKTNMQGKIEVNKTTKKLNEKEKKIADYYSQDNKKSKKAKEKNEIEK